MKKSFITASPFLMLLVPVFFCIALLSFYSSASIPAEKVAASTIFQLPSLKSLIRVVL